MKFYSSLSLSAHHFLTNRALNYGDGLFETMLYINGKIPLFELHIERLNQGLKRLNIMPLLKVSLLSTIQSLVCSKQNCIVKLVVYRDDNKRGYGSESNQSQFFITVNDYQTKETNKQLMVSSIHLANQKALAGLKHLNRLEQVLAAQELNQSAYHDALMLNNKACVIETISKNIVLVRDGKLYSPKLNKCGVYGVALRWLEQRFAILRKKIPLKTLDDYQGFLVCNSISGFNAITNIDNKFQFEANLPIITEIKQKWEMHFN
jgi:4-amino-4-deoxychorismate lyase